MFDIGASELFLVAIVALIVLGPERLPKAARFAGLWVRRARAQWYSVKSELERELAADELKRSLRDGQDALRNVEASIRDTDAEVRREFDALRGDVERGGTDGTLALDAPLSVDAADAAEPPALDTSDAAAQEPADVRR